jgi:clan AA aspartic protease
MGEVRTEITLVNIGDQNDARRGYIPQEQVRRLTVNAVVDTGATTLIINEEIRDKLGLLGEDAGEVTLAGGIKAPCQETETVKIHWKNRRAACEAIVVPGEEDVLLGVLPLEAMDLMVHPFKREVIGAHGDKKLNLVR